VAEFGVLTLRQKPNCISFFSCSFWQVVIDAKCVWQYGSSLTVDDNCHPMPSDISILEHHRQSWAANGPTHEALAEVAFVMLSVRCPQVLLVSFQKAHSNTQSSSCPELQPWSVTPLLRGKGAVIKMLRTKSLTRETETFVLVTAPFKGAALVLITN
jgi:hypothetical protein